MKRIHRFCLFLLIGGICILTTCGIYFSLFSDKNAEQLFYENREHFEDIAFHMINNATSPILVESRDTWPQELKSSLQNITSKKPSIIGIFHDAKHPTVLHFSFVSSYEGKDEENIDIWIRQELVYSESVLPSTFLVELIAPTGIYYYDEQVEKIEENWYIGSYRVY